MRHEFARENVCAGRRRIGLDEVAEPGRIRAVVADPTDCGTGRGPVGVKVFGKVAFAPATPKCVASASCRRELSLPERPRPG